MFTRSLLCPIYDARKIYAHSHIKITRYWTEFTLGSQVRVVGSRGRLLQHLGEGDNRKERAGKRRDPLPIFPHVHLPPGKYFLNTKIFSKHVGMT